MSAFTYHIDQEKDQLIVHLKEAPGAPSSQDKEVLAFLAQKGSPIDPLQRIYIPAAHSWEALKHLSLTRKLHYHSRKVFFDPFSLLQFFIEVEELPEGKLRVVGKWKRGDAVGLLSEMQCLFPADPPWCIHNGVVQAFQGDIAWKWYALVYPHVLQGMAAHQFLQESESHIVWLTKKPSRSLREPLPYLVLSDRSGAFADLWFDYGELGNVCLHEVSTAPWRQLHVEKGWEKDLLETAFIPKVVGTTHYYCPLDQVAKSLTFLLEVGWKIWDHRQRRVVQGQGISLQCALENEHIVVRGKVSYADHEANVCDVMGAFNRREQFLELGSGAVGLIDHHQIEKELGDLRGEEMTLQGIRLKKNRVGLLSSLLEKGILADVPIDWVKKLQGQTLQSEEAPPSPLFQGKLLPYQQHGVDWLHFLYTWGFSGLLADEMGLGKTVQVLAFFSRLSPIKPSLIVMPTSLIFNWKREIEKFLPSVTPYLHVGKDRERQAPSLQEKTLILTSYATLRQDEELLQSLTYELVVLDEGQNIKNPESQIAAAVFRLKGHMRLVMSGTPIENRWEDLWSLFHFLMPDLLGEQKEFTRKMHAAALDSRYLSQTKRKVRPFLLRRKKEEVAQDLPDKIEQVVWVEMGEGQRAMYEEWVHSQAQGLLKKITLEGVSAHRMEILEAILRLRQICAHPLLVDGETEVESGKWERLFSDLDEVVSEGRKVLIYSQFTQMLRLIEKEVQKRYGKYVYLDGSTREREKVVQQFQQDPDIQLFLISLKAGGVGLNLTAADYVFLYDPWWNEAVEAQAIDRAHRIGRQGAVIARRYVTALSIEEKLMRLKEHKRGLAEGILGEGEGIAALTMDDLIELLQ